MRNYWNYHIDTLWTNGYEFHPVRVQTYWMFHFKTTNLKMRFLKNTKVRPFVSIQSMHFVFPFCPIEVGNIVVPISKQTWESEATLLSDFWRFFPLRVFTREVSNNSGSWAMKFTLRSLILRPKTYLLDRAFTEFIFPNVSTYKRFGDVCFCCSVNLPYNSSLGRIERFKKRNRSCSTKVYNQLPTLGIRDILAETFITTDRDEYTFLTCDDAHNNDPPDFLVLFMPFTKLIWALIFIAIFGLPLFLSMIQKDFKWTTVLSDFNNALLKGWAMILEQSYLRVTNNNKGRRGPFNCYCRCVLLAIFTFSIAYKGGNISKLTTKPFEFLVPLTNMDQVKKAGYTTRSVKICFEVLGNYFCKDSFYHEKDNAEDRAQYIDHEQLKLWVPMGHKLLNQTLLSVLTNDKKIFDSHYDIDVKFFGKCEKDALLGWRSNLVRLEDELRLEFESAQIYIGAEFIFSRRYGWQLQRYGSIKVLKRMWTLVESGVYGKLVNISYKPPLRYKASGPRPLKIRGNISVLFIYNSCGLLLALLAISRTMMKRIAILFSLVSEVQHIGWLKLFGFNR